MEREIKKYFHKIEQKKITRKIINQVKYQKGILITMGILFSIYSIWAFKSRHANNGIQGMIYITLWFMGYMVFFIFLLYVFIDNKEFDNYSISDQQFYLLYLLKNYMYSTEYNKDISLYLVSICRYYVRVLNRQKNIIRSHNPFKVLEEELLLEHIRDCFLDKIIGSINKQENIEQIKKIIDILFYINVQGTILINRESNINKVNTEIQSMIKEYIEVESALPIVKDESNRIKNGIEFISEVMEKLRKYSGIKVIVLTVIITSIYTVVEWIVNNEISILGIFSILLMAPPALIIFMNNIDKRNKDDKD